MADVTERMLRLLATLQAGRAFTGVDLATLMEVSPRTLRRDIERLRGYGYPVATRPGPGGSYQLAAGQRMPPLVLDDDEAIATVIGLATLMASAGTRQGGVQEAAGRAYAKIDSVLPARLKPRASALRASIEAEGRPIPEIAAGALGDLAEAIVAHELVTFDYVDAHDTRTQRRVEAHRQVHIDQRWYLFAWDPDRSDWRVFRTDRITNLRRTGRVYTPRALPSDSAITYLRSGLGDS